MDLGAAGLSRQPFPSHGKPLAVVTYSSQHDALEVLRETHEHPTGLALLQGPTLSGKSILIRSFLESIDPECAQAHYNLGLAFADAKIFGEALLEWKKVVEIDGDGDLGRTAAENVELIQTYMELEAD